MDQEEKKESYEIAFWTKEEGEGSVKKVLSKYGAATEREKPVFKMRLAFPIKKENFAFLGTVVFSVKPGSLSAIAADLNLETGILRYFLRRAKKPTAESRNDGSEAGTKERKPFFRMREEKRESDRVLTNEALEKKIEEILQ